MAWKTSAPHATTSVCPRCDAPVYVQRDGLPFVVTADAERLTPEQARKLTGPNRLAWCLRESKWSPARLLEVLAPFHNRECPWPHVVDHQCPEGTPAVKGALW
jgi:hypothetical protein